MEEIGLDLKAHVRDVLEGWKQLAAATPWVAFPDEEWLDDLPAVIAGMADAALLHPGQLESLRSVAVAAGRHGQDRRGQEVPQEILFEEYHHVRSALWHYLARRYDYSTDASKAILRLDSAITLATTASLCGYHREEMERQGKWPDCLERLARESPLLKLGK